jgi:hypothetical protein
MTWAAQQVIALHDLPKIDIGICHSTTLLWIKSAQQLSYYEVKTGCQLWIWNRKQSCIFNICTKYLIASTTVGSSKCFFLVIKWLSDCLLSSPQQHHHCLEAESKQMCVPTIKDNKFRQVLSPNGMLCVAFPAPLSITSTTVKSDKYSLYYKMHISIKTRYDCKTFQLCW